MADRARFVTTEVEIEGRIEKKVVERPDFDPAPWTDKTKLSIVGCPVPRADALEKVTGRARYTVDIKRPGLLHAAIFRAPIAHGRVAHFDLSRARTLPGVRAVLARSDIPRIERDGGELLDTTIRYAGQPLAAIAADTPAQARAAVRAIAAGFERTPHAVTLEDALAYGAPPVLRAGNLHSAPRIIARGDAVKAMRTADVVVRREYRTPTALHSAIEPHAAVAEWDGDRLTVWESTQGIFHTREELAQAFGLPLAHVRVLQDHMGGGFGAKNGASTAACVAALLARATGRPVRCVYDRIAEQTDAGNRPATIQRVELGAKKSGTLVAVILDADVNMGVGGWEGGPAAIFQELYACPNVRTRERFALTHAGAMASFRAPGHVEGAFALERAMDELARTLGMDPVELRLKNLARKSGRTGRTYSSNHLAECYRDGARRIGWADRRSVRTGRVRRGFGMAAQIWGGGGGPPAYAQVRMNPDGSVDVLTGSQDLGTGSRTVFAQIAAEALGAKLESVRVILGDTERTPYTGNSWGSQTVASVGPAVRMAAEDARARLLEAAAGMMGVAPGRLEASESRVRVKGGAKKKTFAEIGQELGQVMIIGHGSRGPNPDALSLSTFGAQFAEVEVDTETGIVRVLRIVASHDSGRIVNPMLAVSQLEGGIIQGLGYALFEERVMDRALGLPLNANLHDYKVPTLADIPAIDARFVRAVDPKANHVGARGVGEPPIIPTAPAIANAVADALGVEVAEIPLTPWRVLAALA